MAEGDTLHRARQRLEPVLGGQRLEAFWARKFRGHRPRPGFEIERVRAHGKHLMIDFERDLTVHTHLGMAGHWRVVEPDSRHVPENDPKLRLLLATSRGTALCFAAPTVESFLRSRPTPLDHLGPDVCAPNLPLDLVLGRAREGDAARSLADLLLDQSVAAGIGNIFKSETLHLCGCFPFSAVEDIGDDTLRAVYSKAASLMRANIESADQQRATHPAGGFFAYKRSKLPCFRCGTPIRLSYKGEHGRSTYWCPACQRER